MCSVSIDLNVRLISLNHSFFIFISLKHSLRFFSQGEIRRNRNSYHLDPSGGGTRASSRMSRFIASWGVARPFEELSDMAKLSNSLAETVRINRNGNREPSVGLFFSSNFQNMTSWFRLVFQ